MNVKLSREFIEQHEISMNAKMKYLQAYATLVHRIKTRTDDFVCKNFQEFMDQTKIVELFNQKQKKQLHQLMQMTSLRTARNPHF